MPRKQLIQVRRDTAANWTSVNPVLAAGEHGFELNTNQLKVGDGSTPWNTLKYIAGNKVSKDTLVYDVKDYGAKGDGVANDTTSIQAAIDAASAAGGGEVFIPRGLYIISSRINLRSRVSVRGVGHGNNGSANLAASAGSTIKQITPSTDGFYLETAGVDSGYLRIENLTILGVDYNTANISSGVNIRRTTSNAILDIHISGIAVRGFGQWGIAAEALINSVIEKSLVAYNGGGINVYGQAGWPATSTTVRNNYANWNLNIGFRFNYTDYSSIVQNASDHQDIHYQVGDCTNVTVSGNGAEWNATDAPANGIGYDVWGSRFVTMDTNFVLGNKNTALRVRSSPTYACTNVIVRNFRNAIPYAGTTGLNCAANNFMMLDGQDIGAGSTVGTIVGSGVVYNLSALYANVRINGAGDAIYSVKSFIPRDNLSVNLGDGTHKWNSLNVGTITTTYGTGITFASGSSMVFDEGGAGTKFGTTTTQKLGFYGTTPVSQRSGNLLTAIAATGLVASPTIAQADVTDLVSDLAAKSPTTSPTFTGIATAPIFTATNTMRITGAAGTDRGMAFQTSGLNRWIITVSTTSEAGSNSGSNLAFNTYDDAGTYLATPIIITRSSGAVNIFTPLSIPSSVTAGGNNFNFPAVAGTLVGRASTDTLTNKTIDGGSNTLQNIAQSSVTSLTSDLALKAPLASPAFTGTPTGITATHVGLGNVDNTSDANKPVSTAQQTAIDARLLLTGGTLTGTLNARDILPSTGGTYALGSSSFRYLTGFFSAINVSGSTGIAFNTNNSSAVGSSSVYASNVFGIRHTFNTTAFIDGTTAGQMAFTGNLAAASNYGSDLGTAGGAFATVRAGVFRADYAVGLAFAAGSNIQIDTATGTKIGTATGQKIGFWNVTPVVQQVLATGVAHTVDDVITLLQTLGLARQA